MVDAPGEIQVGPAVALFVPARERPRVRPRARRPAPLRRVGESVPFLPCGGVILTLPLFSDGSPTPSDSLFRLPRSAPGSCRASGEAGTSAATGGESSPSILKTSPRGDPEAACPRRSARCGAAGSGRRGGSSPVSRRPSPRPIDDVSVNPTREGELGRQYRRPRFRSPTPSLWGGSPRPYREGGTMRRPRSLYARSVLGLEDGRPAEGRPAPGAPAAANRSPGISGSPVDPASRSR